MFWNLLIPGPAFESDDDCINILPALNEASCSSSTSRGFLFESQLICARFRAY